jgi:hypothetical protein
VARTRKRRRFDLGGLLIARGADSWLLVGEFDDPDLVRLCDVLHGRGDHVVFFPLRDPADRYRMGWDLGTLPWLEADGLRLSRRELASATAGIFKLSRMDELPLVPCSWSSDLETRALAEREWSAALLSALQVLLDQNRLLVGRPADDYWHDRKLLFLTHAIARGISVPATSVGTQVSAGAGWNGAIAKAINANPWLRSGELLPSTLLPEQVVDWLDQNALQVPSLIQERIQSRCETRLVLIGEAGLAVDVSHTGEALDIRLARDIEVRAVRQPDLFEESVLSLARQSRMSYACFDILNDDRGERWLVDVTPRGTWSWLESDNDLLVTEAIADALMAQGD